MTLFCDTSALFKRYIEEKASETIKQAIAREVVCVCRITWVETMAAFARRVREMPDDFSAVAQARQKFCDDWPDYVVIDVTQPLVELAGELAESFSLRGYDSVQLAAAKIMHDATGDVTFACFDERLNKAAKLLGMKLV